MILAIASGKGGTGKTTIAVNLALTLGAQEKVTLLDCDVEEPNCSMFLRPEIRKREPVGMRVPVVDESKCTACGNCGRICEYGAIALMGNRVLVFPEMCHGCGGCAKVCLPGAIEEKVRVIGVVESGVRNGVEFIQGRLNVGQPMSPPVIKAVKERAGRGGWTIIDCPPGTSCPVVTAVRGSDFVLLVTEPTPFGLNDLKLAVDMVRVLGIPLGVAVNRVGIGDERIHRYCREENVPILLEIPDDRRIAEAYSRGGLIVEALPEYRGLFQNLRDHVYGSLLFCRTLPPAKSGEARVA